MNGYADSIGGPATVGTGHEDGKDCVVSLFIRELFALRRSLVLLIVSAIGVLPAFALEQVKYPEPPDTLAFKVEKNGESVPVTLRQLEKLGLYSVTTPSPFEKGQLTFQGVLFRDVLKLIGLEGEGSVTLPAQDDYVQIIPKEDWRRALFSLPLARTENC
ncbi:hypothetical protein EH240_33565 [Mesorhizobium tamadayense]|uniref:Oxidoreductase molybdopterin-binding domain-containing protein n=1 Tax=Mesorhizobium tamadayense TaxID=425306 RepID=A0A3P3EUJ6_9HYPH|nr:hypothetical protein [Mesorhizobium tamadayense]RRH90059.1 hypothetical protein EH240_33565 [Mesorhizobium tamadayense]